MSKRYNTCSVERNQVVFDEGAFIKEAQELITTTVNCDGRYFSREDREDIIMIAVEKAWRYRHTFDPAKSQFQTWCAKIARNCMNDAYRDRKRQNDLFSSIDDAQEQYGDSLDWLASDEYSADRLAEKWSEERLLSHLAPQYQEAIRLEAEGYRPRDIALRKGTTPVQ